MRGEKLDIVDEAKLLGVIITSDLKWNRNTLKGCKFKNENAAFGFKIYE